MITTENEIDQTALVEMETQVSDLAKDDLEKSDKRRRYLVWGLRLAVLVAIIGVWQLVVTFQLLSPTAVAAPLAVVNQLVDWFSTGFIWPHLSATLIVFGAGFVLGMLGGIILGVLGGAVPFLRYYMSPYVAFFNSLPRLVLIPFFVLIFGFTNLPGIIVTALSVVFMVILTVQSGMDEIGDDYIQNARALGGGWFDQLRTVYLPGVAIWIFAAARSSIGMAFQAAVVSQYFGSPVGIGYLIAQGGFTLNAPQVFAGIVITAVLAFLVDLIVRLLDRRFERPDLAR